MPGWGPARSRDLSRQAGQLDAANAGRAAISLSTGRDVARALPKARGRGSTAACGQARPPGGTFSARGIGGRSLAAQREHDGSATDHESEREGQQQEGDLHGPVHVG